MCHLIQTWNKLFSRIHIYNRIVKYLQKASARFCWSYCICNEKKNAKREDKRAHTKSWGGFVLFCVFFFCSLLMIPISILTLYSYPFWNVTSRWQKRKTLNSIKIDERREKKTNKQTFTYQVLLVVMFSNVKYMHKFAINNIIIHTYTTAQVNTGRWESQK